MCAEHSFPYKTDGPAGWLSADMRRLIESDHISIDGLLPETTLTQVTSIRMG
ncbi:hypothetical protein NWFMUON74_44350 [Nocardia wallacei]|uniref:Uncharacterized protein n=1 Tax=Nocardia wallacei TaxID=480035 RepID=A0A7G1KR37_9NOCA|nr:hypothetical protein NWFMUON74_44350 [Nocardia wallacei]